MNELTFTQITVLVSRLSYHALTERKMRTKIYAPFRNVPKIVINASYSLSTFKPCKMAYEENTELKVRACLRYCQISLTDLFCKNSYWLFL